MEDVTINDAKEHLEELLDKAAKGGDVRIVGPNGTKIQLLPVDDFDPEAPRVTDLMPPFVPLKQPRKFGRLKGKLPPPPDDFFDPLSEQELRDWDGDEG